MQGLMPSPVEKPINRKQVQSVAHIIKRGDRMSEINEKDVIETIVRLLEDQTGEKLEYELIKEQTDKTA